MQQVQILIVPGNGGAKPNDLWFPYVKSELEKVGIAVVVREFPDSYLARASYWLPFLKNELKADEKSILVGHSSGAIAALRFAETYKILGTVLVAAYHTDLGIENEKLSGYFDKPWDWAAIQANQQWIVQFASTNDPWIPIEEPRYVHKMLNTTYYESSDQGHFGGDYNKTIFPELVAAIKEKLRIE